MRGTSRVARAALPAAAGLAVALVATPAFAGQPPPPKPAATVHTQPGIGIAVHLGAINLDVSVPLNLGGLLGTRPSAAPTSSAPPPSSAPPTRPTRQATKPATQPTGRHHSSTVAARSTAQTLAAPRTSAAPTRPKAHHHKSAHPKTPPSSHRNAITSLFHNPITPDSGAALLLSLAGACALGVAGVVLLGGRRGRHSA